MVVMMMKWFHVISILMCKFIIKLIGEKNIYVELRLDIRSLSLFDLFEILGQPIVYTAARHNIIGSIVILNMTVSGSTVKREK